MPYRWSGPVVVGALLLGLNVPSVPASHADGDYDGPVWFEWNRLQLEVLVFPAESGQVRNSNGILGGPDPAEANPCTNSYTRALRDAIDNWKFAVSVAAAAWLKNGFQLTPHVVGCDPPTAFPARPDIVVITDQTKGPVLGVAVKNDPCVINNSRISTNLQSFTYADMFNVMGHEFAHCLGLGHTGDLDGGTVGDASHPSHDIVEGIYEHSVGSQGVHLHCVSNLNVRVLEAVFDGNTNPSQIVEMPVAQYQWIDSPQCNNAGEPVT